jgi:nitrite reductase (NADH) small subunit
MAFVKAATLSAVPPGTSLEVTIGDAVYALCNTGEAITALDGLCPHRGGPLGHGPVDRDRVVCPWHLWEFDCRTGEYDRNPNIKLATHPVRVEGVDIFIDVEDPGA